MTAESITIEKLFGNKSKCRSDPGKIWVVDGVQDTAKMGMNQSVHKSK